jgi:hypothetical protein
MFRGSRMKESETQGSLRTPSSIVYFVQLMSVITDIALAKVHASNHHATPSILKPKRREEPLVLSRLKISQSNNHEDIPDTSPQSSSSLLS